MKDTSDTRAVSARNIYFFRQRQRNAVFQAVLAFFAEKAEKEGLTKRELARRLGKDPAQITRWFAGPGNWTLDTVSDLLLAMGAAPGFSIEEFDLIERDENWGRLSKCEDTPISGRVIEDKRK